MTKRAWSSPGEVYGVDIDQHKSNKENKTKNLCSIETNNPGEVYGVDIDTGNSGALYADSFVLHEHYR